MLTQSAIAEVGRVSGRCLVLFLKFSPVETVLLCINIVLLRLFLSELCRWVQNTWITVVWSPLICCKVPPSERQDALPRLPDP